MKNYLITIKGKVQGVFFRKCTKEMAEKLGITGWVKNEENGDVTVSIEGEESVCFTMLDWLKSGSPRSEVKSLFIEKQQCKDHQQFKIIR